MDKKAIITAIVVAVIFGGGGFYGGIVYGKNAAVSQRQNNFAQMGGNFSGRSGNNAGGTGSAGQNRQSGAMRNGGGFIAGQITAKDDKSITVQDRSGSSKIILYSGSTTVGKAVAGATSDLSTGENVMVSGTTNSDGSVTAENIQIRPATPQGQANGAGAPAPAATN